jgi:two-component system CheB/CheR fusion protein
MGGSAGMTTAPDPSFEELLGFVRDSRGFDYAGYRRPTLMRRFQKRMEAVHAESWGDYRTYLETHPEEFSDLFNTILINVTGFFRDRETWDVVASDVIPRLLESRDDDSTIRVWSAGCASGEEPYSVAMLLAEALGEGAFRRRVKIYATDIDEESLTEAREAVYPAKAVQAVPPRLRERYFVDANHGGGLAFRTDLRRCVIFGRNDLHHDPPISRVDLLLSRNTLMYFAADVQARILANFYFALNRGGFLVVGKAEALQSGRRFFVPHDLKRRVFVKDGSLEPAFHVPRLPPFEPAVEEREAPDLGEMAFEHAPIAQILLDERNQIVSLNQAARTMFGLKLKDVGRRLQDLEISYRPLELRSLLDETRSERRAVARKNVRWTPPGADEPRSLDVQVAPLAGPGGAMAGVTVSFLDTTAHRALEEDLERSRRELETAYEELQSTVEELETTNEELQSTNEELETTNEELQSTNEELETMNEELQSTNEELETMNDELRERTDETLRANSFIGSVLASIQQAVVVVDRTLQIIAWNRRASELWGLRDDEAEGAHLLNLDIGIPVARLRDPIRQVLAGDQPEQLLVEGHDRRGKAARFSVSFAPLRAQIDGAELDGAILLVDAERVG